MFGDGAAAAGGVGGVCVFVCVAWCVFDRGVVCVWYSMCAGDRATTEPYLHPYPNFWLENVRQREARLRVMQLVSCRQDVSL